MVACGALTRRGGDQVSPWTKDGNLYNPLLNPHRCFTPPKPNQAALKAMGRGCFEK